jgi:hypothetical protein
LAPRQINQTKLKIAEEAIFHPSNCFAISAKDFREGGKSADIIINDFVIIHIGID